MGWMKKLGLGCGGLFALVVVGIGGTAAYAFATADSRLYRPDVPLPALQASADPAVIAAGEYLVHGPAHCSQCHGAVTRQNFASLNPSTPLSGGVDFPMGPFGTTYAANLTSDPATGLGSRTDAELARAIQSGILHDGRVSFLMQLSAANVSNEDTVAIISYLRTLAPVTTNNPPHTIGAMPIFALFLPIGSDPTTVPAHVPPSEEPSIERGKYLADSAMLCQGCHTAFDMGTFKNTGPAFAGGTCEPSHDEREAGMEYCAPNLTSSSVGVTGRFDEEGFLARMKHGRTAQGSIMPWENMKAVTDTDLRSVYRYLKTVPPSDNDQGPSFRKSGWKAGDPVQ
jgi:mono/diheme cytochrome c family protein